MKKLWLLGLLGAGIPLLALASSRTDKFGVGRTTPGGDDTLRLTSADDLVVAGLVISSGTGVTIYRGALQVDGSTTLGDAAASDTVVVNSSVTLNGLVNSRVQTFGTAAGASGVYVSSQLVPTSNYVTYLSSGGALLLSGTPTIATSTVLLGNIPFADGTLLVITSTASAGAITFQDNDTLSGSRLELGSTTRAVGQGDILCLLYIAPLTEWFETCFVNN